jgi:methyltransferase-like protein
MPAHAIPKRTYDEILVPAQPVPHSRPDRLAAVATLFGMHPRPVDRCRVLELGCANGANLIPMADRHPESSFLGIDSSPLQVALGQAAIQELGLTNVELRHMDFRDATDGLGTFDYVVCAGVYSRVTADARVKLLAACKASLAPQGVVYVSYHCLPGWQVGQVLREVARDIDLGELSSGARVVEFRKRLEFFSEVLTGDPAPHACQLKDEIDRALSNSDGYLFQEYLEGEHEACYFHEFATHAAAHGLYYVGDAVPSTMFPAGFGQTIENNLRFLGNDVIAMEQHIDLLRNRAIRQSLLCHRGTDIQRQLTPAGAFGLHFSGDLRPVSAQPDMTARTPEAFVDRHGVELTIRSPLIKSAVYKLGRCWPRSCSLDELLIAARPGGDGQAASIQNSDREALGRGLLQCLAAGMVEIQSEPDRFVGVVSDRPAASAVARWQARCGTLVTNRRHEQIQIDNVANNVLRCLDGQHDRKDLVRLLIEAMDRGELTILINNLPPARDETLVGMLERTLDQCLERLAASALLIA